MFKDISNFSNINDYLPILNGAVLSDIIIIFILYYTPFFNSKYLMKWYETYRLSGIIADVFIIIIGFVITRYIYSRLNLEWNPLKFLLLYLIVQITHDFLFYLFFNSVPRGLNRMLDLFKDYAIEVSYKAILGDSFMIIIAVIAAMIFANFSLNTNIIILVVLIYLIPFVLYTR
tara:strand:+ start:361 stop:882 length:522 start_codon:yes stop_codon:yes gene_type:complete